MLSRDSKVDRVPPVEYAGLNGGVDEGDDGVSMSTACVMLTAEIDCDVAVEDISSPPNRSPTVLACIDGRGVRHHSRRENGCLFQCARCVRKA